MVSPTTIVREESVVVVVVVGGAFSAGTFPVEALSAEKYEAKSPSEGSCDDTNSSRKTDGGRSFELKKR